MNSPSHSFTQTESAADAARNIFRLGVAAALACLLLSAALPAARAQNANVGSPPGVGGARDRDADSHSPGREEMLRNLEIRRREQAYKENIGRAKEGAAIGAELRRAYERAKSLGPAEQKKLGRLEKLARSIREQAGGDDDEEAPKELPEDLGKSFERLEQLSGELQSRVEKTPRHVVSTSVIDTANQLLKLIRHVRAFLR